MGEQQGFYVGLQVEVRGEGAWRKGTVTGQRANGKWEVQPDGWSKAYVWPELRLIDITAAQAETKVPSASPLPKGTAPLATSPPKAKALAATTVQALERTAGTKRPAEDGGAKSDDDDDDVLLAPGVAKPFGGLGGREMLCYQGARCMNPACPWLHPQKKQAVQPVTGYGKARVVKTISEDAPKSALPATTAAPKIKAKGLSAAPKVGAVAASPSMASGSHGPAVATAPKAQVFESQAPPGLGSTGATAKAATDSAAPPRTLAAEAAGAADAEAAPVSDEMRSLLAENKALRTKIMMAQLRADNANMKSKELETKQATLEVQEQRLQSSVARLAAFSATSARGRVVGKGRGAGRGRGSLPAGIAENDLCWEYRATGNCKNGASCNWIHR